MKHPKIKATTKALLFHAIRTYRSYDVLGHIEESLTHAEWDLLNGFLKWAEKTNAPLNERSFDGLLLTYTTRHS